MTPSRPLRAVSYVRLSSYRGASDPTTSPQRQREACASYAAAKGWTVADVVEDLDVSGSAKGLRLDRPGLHRLRAMFDEVDVIVFAKLDRLARSVVDFRAFADEAEAHGVALVSVAESLDMTTPSGRFVATILSAFAEMEAETIAARTVAGIAGAVALGRWRGGVAPYGYRIAPHPSGSGRTLEVDPEAAAHIRAALEHVLDGGSLYGALHLLEERGSTPPKAKAWGISSVRAVLVGDSILGRLRHRGQLVRGEDGLPLQPFPAIISATEAARVRARLERRPREATARRASRLLSGLLTCSTCGARLRVHSTGQGERRVCSYGCHGRTDGRRCSRPVSINAAHVEEHVSEWFLDRFGAFAVVETRETTEDDSRLADVEHALSEVTEAMRAPGADVVALAEQVTALHARRQELAAAPPTRRVEHVTTGETFAEAWESADVDGRRLLLRSALASPAVVSPGVRGRRGFDAERVTLQWRGEGQPDEWHDPTD